MTQDMIVTTEAIVLKTMNYRDTSKIVTLYTRDFGRLSVVAKGCRSPGNRFGASLEPLSLVSAILYKKENRDLHLLSKCEILRPHRRISEDLERLGTAMVVAELVNAVAHQEERNHDLFVLILNVLETVENATNNPRNALYSFEMKLSEVLGFRPNLQTCLKCNSELDEKRVVAPGVGLELIHGGVLCSQCVHRTHTGKLLSPPSFRVLQQLQEQFHPMSSTSIVMRSETRDEVAMTLRLYLRNHIEGLKELKSEGVFASMV